MPLHQVAYPVALSSLSVGAGWVLYRSLGSLVGLLLVSVGVLVALALLGGRASAAVAASGR
jgi:hypothetical protein